MAGRRKLGEAVSQTNASLRAAAPLSVGETSNPPATVVVAQGHKRRKAGKRSDPAFRPTTIFVRKETQRKATRLLEDYDTGKDFSDLVEELVSNWVTQNSHA